MQDPFAVLELSPDATLAEIRKQYLTLTRKYPPDRAPDKFQEIRTAYEELANPIERWRRVLFSVAEQSTVSNYADRRRLVRRQRIPAATLLQIGGK